MIYFDNSATTKISEAAKRKMNEVMEQSFGNPSSLHRVGLDAEKVLSGAREIILDTLGVRRGVRGELIFTSGGTESNNIAIFGSVLAKKRHGGEKILTTVGEHASVSEPMKRLESLGYKVIYVPTKNGELDLDFIEDNADGAILASFMHVNNETGALYSLESAFKIVREKSRDCVCHADCVQSYLKVRFTPKSLGAHLVSISAHKIGGAKGAGALYVDPDIIKTKRLVPITLGGGQENGMRSGTENVYSIAAMGEAAREGFLKMAGDVSKMRALRSFLTDELSKIEGVRVNEPKKSAPHIINITVFGIRSETLLHFMSSRGIYISSGSACSSNAKSKHSTALEGFGVSADEADSSVRISLCPTNTENEARELISALYEGITQLAKK